MFGEVICCIPQYNIRKRNIYRIGWKYTIFTENIKEELKCRSGMSKMKTSTWISLLCKPGRRTKQPFRPNNGDALIAWRIYLTWRNVIRTRQVIVKYDSQVKVTKILVFAAGTLASLAYLQSLRIEIQLRSIQASVEN